MRCVWLDTPLAQAQVNVVERLIERCGSLPAPDEVRLLAQREPGMLMPTSQMRALRELEPPSTDEGFARVERTPFVRAPSAAQTGHGVLVAANALLRPGWAAALEQGDRTVPHLVFDWRPDGRVSDLDVSIGRIAAEVSGLVEGALCSHAPGPPTCWCRPPLPGLPLAFAYAHRLNPSRSVLVGTGPAHRTLATTLGSRFVLV